MPASGSGHPTPPGHRWSATSTDGIRTPTPSSPKATASGRPVSRASNPATSTSFRSPALAIDRSTKPTRLRCGLRSRPERLRGRGTSTTNGTTVMDGCSERHRVSQRAGQHLRGSCRVVARLRRRQLSGNRPAARRLRARMRIHPRRVPAAHGAPVLRIVGISEHRLLCPDLPVRDARGPHVPDRSPPSKRESA